MAKLVVLHLGVASILTSCGADRVWSASGTDPAVAAQPSAMVSVAPPAPRVGPKVRVAFPWDGQVLSTSKASRIRVLFDVERFAEWDVAQLCLRAASLGSVPCVSLAAYGQFAAETGGGDAMYELSGLAPGRYEMYAELLSADGRASIATSPPVVVFVTSGRATAALLPQRATPVVLNLAAIDAVEYRRYAHLVRSESHFSNVEYFAAAAGEEHYRLLATLSRLCSTAPGTPPFVDLGTFYGLSAFALASAPNARVISFDVEDRASKIAALNGMSRGAFGGAVPNVVFNVQNILRGDGEGRSALLRAPLVLLDTFHEPNTVPFEQEVIEFLLANHFKGIIVVDDIHLNLEMVRWWKALAGPGLRKWDVTAVGHGISGTGLLDFGDRLQVI